MRIFVLSALVGCVALVVAGCGGGESGESRAAAPAAPAANGVDRAFVDQMVPHSEEGLELAEIAADRSEDEFVSKTATDLMREHREQLEVLRTEQAALEEAGVEPDARAYPHSFVAQGDTENRLRETDAVEQLFLNFMVNQHLIGVDLARVEVEQGSDPEIKGLAQQMIDSHVSHVEAMEQYMHDHGWELEHEH